MSEREPQQQNTPEKTDGEFLPASSVRRKDKRTTRGFWIKTAFMLVLIGASIAVMFTITDYLSPEGTLSLKELIKGIDWRFFAILIGVIVLYILVESGKYAFLLKISTKKFRFRTSFKTMFLGKYYDGITPLSTGGQPFQIYYLHKKHDIPQGVATAIPLVRYIVSAIVITVISIALLILTPFIIKDNETLTVAVLVMSWISLALNCMFPVAIILFSAYPNATKRMIAGIIHVLYKMHIVKHKFLVMNKWLRELNAFGVSIKMFAKKIKYSAPLVILAALECMINYTVPFFVVVAIAGPEAVPPTWELWVQIICLSMITRYTALLIPTPGNTGAVETAGSLVFITVLTDALKPVMGWVVFVWRFITYYMYILTGIGINIFEVIRGAVDQKRASKREHTE